MRTKRYLFLAGVLVCALSAVFCFWQFHTTEGDISLSSETVIASDLPDDVAERVERALALSAEVIAAGRSNLGDLDGEALEDVLLAVDRLTVGREALLDALKKLAFAGEGCISSDVDIALEDLEGILSEYIR